MVVQEAHERSPSFKGLTAASSNASKAAKGASKKHGNRPELTLRRALWSKGYRYRLSNKHLPGKPDIVFPSQMVAIFCDGDFWHGKDLESRLTKLAKRHNGDYWVKKIQANVARDHRNTARLEQAGWLVIRLWESQIMKDTNAAVAHVEAALNSRGCTCRVKPAPHSFVAQRLARARSQGGVYAPPGDSNKTQGRREPSP